MVDVKIFLKSGQIVEFVSENVTVKTNGFGDTVGLNWKNVPDEATLLDIGIDQIAAITYKNRG